MQVIHEEELAPYRANMFAILNAFPLQAPVLRTALVVGALDGGKYDPEAECSCIFGTIARAQHNSERWAINTAQRFGTGLGAGRYGPVERLLFDVIPGETPENNRSAAVLLALIDEWMTNGGNP